MKSRAQLMDHSEDWVDGSWTVDCVCGVNFDDGEEMVDCDECGVWVHTRCSRYVKGKKSFACDKCKLKNNRNISEETEVAQLLVDLPKNTMKMEDSYRFNDAASRRPLRLWTEKPMEDRVHVHGIPGGDPQLFTGLSGIFTPQLWKATGYVPKKFNFRYKEFPCWEQDEEKISKDPDETQSPIDTGANALYSMSKETVFGDRLRIPLGTRLSEKGENFDSKLDAKEPKSLRHANPDADFFHDDSENEKSTHQSSVFNYSQQRKDLITSQNRTGKRKSRASDKDTTDGKKRVRHSSGTVVFSTASNSKINESSGDKDAKIFRNDSQSAMNYGNSADKPKDLVLKSDLPNEDSSVKAKKYSKCDHVLEPTPGDTVNCNSAIEATQKVEKAGSQATAVIGGDVKISSSLTNNVEPFSSKEEVAGSISCFDSDENQREKSADVMINKADIELPPSFMHPAVPQVQESQISQDSIVSICNQTQQPKLQVYSLSSNIKISGDGLKHSIDHSVGGSDPVNCKVDVRAVSSSSCGDKDHVVQADSNAVNFYAHASDEFNDTCVTPNLESSEGCKTLKVTSIENNHDSVQAENYLETGEATHSLVMLPCQRKMVVSVVRSISTNSVFTSVASDDSRAEESRNSSISNRKKEATTVNVNIIKEQAVNVADRDGERRRKNPKESPRASESSVWKSSHFSKNSRSHTSREPLSRSKDLESRSFAKAKQDNIVTSDSGESARSLQAHGVSHGQSKVTSSGSSRSLQKGRKQSQITNNTSSKTCNMPSANRHLLPASHAALSDEELALLLHQELNSSPRVPRVPRMRQAGSLPQSASPTAANMLSKRTSGFGGSDYTSVSRRKYKDPSGDGTHLSAELDVKSKKGDKGSSRNQCLKESTSEIDGISKRELDERSSKTYGAVKRKGPASISATKSHSSSRNSLKNVFDEEIGVGGSPYRTLPGLISEIMSKGQRMTYEELCNAVLPHWHNLRKHNGERYAYSSHSQAVLDCLRNRSEWAQLVDRGPKTNPGRKRRKLDADPATSESDDGMLEKNKVVRVLDNRNISKQHDFPKGKRKARKRRRLALQSREMKDPRKSRSIETVSEDDDGEDDSLYSNSTEQSSSSEDDAQGSGSGPASEASVSSDES